MRTQRDPRLWAAAVVCYADFLSFPTKHTQSSWINLYRKNSLRKTNNNGVESGIVHNKIHHDEVYSKKRKREKSCEERKRNEGGETRIRGKPTTLRLLSYIYKYQVRHDGENRKLRHERRKEKERRGNLQNSEEETSWTTFFSFRSTAFWDGSISNTVYLTSKMKWNQRKRKGAGTRIGVEKSDECTANVTRSTHNHMVFQNRNGY